MSEHKPWRLRYRLPVPLPSGQKVVTVTFTTKESALHEGQRRFDAGCPAVTVVNKELPASRQLVKRWQR